MLHGAGDRQPGIDIPDDGGSILGGSEEAAAGRVEAGGTNGAGMDDRRSLRGAFGEAGEVSSAIIGGGQQEFAGRAEVNDANRCLVGYGKGDGTEGVATECGDLARLITCGEEGTGGVKGGGAEGRIATNVYGWSVGRDVEVEPEAEKAVGRQRQDQVTGRRKQDKAGILALAEPEMVSPKVAHGPSRARAAFCALRETNQEWTVRTYGKGGDSRRKVLRLTGRGQTRPIPEMEPPGGGGGVEEAVARDEFKKANGPIVEEGGRRRLEVADDGPEADLAMRGGEDTTRIRRDGSIDNSVKAGG